MKSVAPLLLLVFLSTSIFGMAKKTFEVSGKLNSGIQETVPLDPSYVVSKTLVEMIAARNLSTYVDTSFEEKKRAVLDHIKNNPNEQMPLSALFPVPMTEIQKDTLCKLIKEMHELQKSKKELMSVDIEPIVQKDIAHLPFILNACNYLDISLLFQASLNVAAKDLVSTNQPLWIYRINPDISNCIKQKIIQNNPEIPNNIPIPCIKTLKGHTGLVGVVSFSPDGTQVVSASNDETIKLWSLKSGQCIKTLNGHTGWVGTVSFSPDGTQVVSGSDDKTIKVWSLESGQCIKTLKETDSVYTVTFSPDGKYIASGLCGGRIKIWCLKSGKCITNIKGHIKGNSRFSVFSVIFSPNGKRVLSGSSDGTIKIWNLKSGRCIATLIRHSSAIDCVNSISMSPSGMQLVSGSSDGTIKVWDIKSSKCLTILTERSKNILSVGFSSDGKHVIYGSDDGTIKIWNVKLGKCLTTFTGHSDIVFSVGFSSDGKHVISGSEDKTIKIWSLHLFNFLAS